MVEAHPKGVIRSERAAEAYAAKQGKLGASFEQQTDDLEKILVPSHRNAVFRHATEAGHGSFAQGFVEYVDVMHRIEAGAASVGVDARQMRRQWFYLEAVYAHHRMAVVHKVVREREAGRPHACDQYAVAGAGARQRAADIERVPARQQRIDLKAPGKFQYILERACFDLGNIDRFLFLVDAGFHAVVADAVPRRCG